MQSTTAIIIPKNETRVALTCELAAYLIWNFVTGAHLNGGPSDVVTMKPHPLLLGVVVKYTALYYVSPPSFVHGYYHTYHPSICHMLQTCRLGQNVLVIIKVSSSMTKEATKYYYITFSSDICIDPYLTRFHKPDSINIFT